MRHPIGTSLIAIGVLHVVYALVRYHGPLIEIVGNGLIGGAETPDQFGAFWFLIAGPLMLLAGVAARSQEAAGLQPGARFGGVLLGSAVLGAAVFPVSGFWLLLVPGILALRSGDGATSQ